MTQFISNPFDDEYHYALQEILRDGEDRGDRTGTGTRSLFGLNMNFDISQNFPAITTKKLAIGGVLGELLWFIEGSGNDNRLRELCPPRQDGRTIWTDNAEAPYWLPKAKYPGDLGRVYGVQWRNWRKFEELYELGDDNEKLYTGLYRPSTDSVDQLQNIIDTIKTNPTDRRMLLSAYNVGELDQMALPPCHMMAQFYVRRGEFLDCQMYQRSADMFLGIPFNIASYAALVYMIAHVTGLKPGRLKMVIGDAHIYNNHRDQVMLQLSRNSFAAPTLRINPAVTDINKFTRDDLVIENYQSHPAISAKMAV